LTHYRLPVQRWQRRRTALWEMSLLCLEISTQGVHTGRHSDLDWWAEAAPSPAPELFPHVRSGTYTRGERPVSRVNA
jgi:hypothetical protein